ncbi:MAG: hypothetical protein PETM_01171 [Petrimonas sp.]
MYNINILTLINNSNIIKNHVNQQINSTTQNIRNWLLNKCIEIIY